jgi:hypothetical protein
MFNKEDLATFITRFEKALDQDIKRTGHIRMARVAERLKARFPTTTAKRMKDAEVLEWTKNFSATLDQIVNELGYDDSFPYETYVRYSNYVNQLRGVGINHTSTCIRELVEKGLPFEDSRRVAHLLVGLNALHPTTFTKLKDPASFLPKKLVVVEDIQLLLETIQSNFLKQF